jgi:cytochrome c553
MERRLLTLTGLALSVIVASCSGSDDAAPATDGGAAQAPAVEERPLSDAVALYSGGTQPSCAFCHGAKGEGAMLGPALDGLGEDWTVDELAAFISDPPAYAADHARLTELAGRYQKPMPKPSGFDASDSRVMARWLLEGMPR